MRIGGLLPLTLSDFPGRVAAVVFTQGCNFRCPFCHNGELIPMHPPAHTLMSEDDLFVSLTERASRLDGVMVTGGEPTLQPDLADFLTRVRSLGLETGIETNGSRPEVLAELISGRLLDFIAMDIKAPPEVYPRLCGVDFPTAPIIHSIALIAGSGIEHQFRTTHVPALLTDADLDAIRLLVPDGSPHVIQPFIPDHALDPDLRET